MQFGDFFRSKKKGWFLNRGGGGVDIKFNSPSTQLYMFAKGGAGRGWGSGVCKKDQMRADWRWGNKK